MLCEFLVSVCPEEYSHIKAGQLIGFHLQPLYHHIVGTGDGVDMQMIRQGLKALDEKTQEPLECDTYGTTNAS